LNILEYPPYFQKVAAPIVLLQALSAITRVVKKKFVYDKHECTIDYYDSIRNNGPIPALKRSLLAIVEKLGGNAMDITFNDPPPCYQQRRDLCGPAVCLFANAVINNSTVLFTEEFVMKYKQGIDTRLLQNDTIGMLVQSSYLHSLRMCTRYLHKLLGVGRYGTTDVGT